MASAQADLPSQNLLHTVADRYGLRASRARRILEVLRAPADRHPRWSLQRVNLRAYHSLA